MPGRTIKIPKAKGGGKMTKMSPGISSSQPRTIIRLWAIGRISRGLSPVGNKYPIDGKWVLETQAL